MMTAWKCVKCGYRRETKSTKGRVSARKWSKILDQNQVTILLSDKLREANRIFDTLDVDESGSLSQSEILVGLLANGFEENEIAATAVHEFFLQDPPKNQFYCRSLFVKAQLEALKAARFAGDKALKQTQKAIAVLLEALEIMLKPENRPRYTPIIAIHLTRPPIVIPDRVKLDIDHYKNSAKGAYIIKNYDNKKPKEGVVIIRGTSPINSLIQILPKLKESGPNIKIVAAISMDLFKMQTREYQQSIISTSEWNDSMIITNTSIKLMEKWIANRFVAAYSMAPDYDNRWRSGGTLDQIIIESKLDSSSIWVGINRFATERSKRLESLKKEIPNF